ncbi:hypothetical protein [Halostreptopolyspora alba]|uniref:Uncharacterized protein n=1 Tax=Halostreptopolyspora alba TaxID=2487137 RepID=A0A3N0E144_9ACTN|nr:hypothetical protein EFW17_21900 [Nocardiopsaceae bacterium YIM 96095]
MPSRQSPWPPRDDTAKVLLDLYDAKILEYHCDEHTEHGHTYRITTAHGYEVTLTPDEVTMFALGAHAAYFAQTLQYPPSAEVVDERIAARKETSHD